MTPRCTELDLFFDGELEADQAAAFRDHLASCERCQRVLHGRMQEAITADAAASAAADALDRAIAEADPGGAAAAEEADDEADPGDVPSARAAREGEVVAAAPAPARDAEIRSCQRRRMLVYAAPALAAAAAFPLWCLHRADAPLELTCEIEHGPTRARGALVGDTLHPVVHGARHRAIVVYLDRHDLRPDLQAACPGNERCHQTGDTLELWVTLKEPGVYTVVALDSDHEIPRPGPDRTLDEVLAGCADCRSRQETIRVDD